MPTDVRKERIDRLLAGLRETRDAVPVERHHVEAEPDVFPDLLDLSRAGYVGGAYAWVTRQPDEMAPLSDTMAASDRESEERALMVLGRGSRRWGLPGGGIEDGEDPAAAARREVREETGIDCRIEEPFLVRRVETTARGHDERLHTLAAFFDATYEDGSIDVQPGELCGAAWFADPPERLLPANERRAADFF